MVIRDRSSLRVWLLPGLVTAVALVVSAVAVVVIVEASRTPTVPAAAPATVASPPAVVGDPGASPDDLPSAPVTSVFPETACQQTVVAALEQDNLAGNRMEAVRIFRSYGDGSPQDRAYSDVEQDYYNAARSYGIAYAAQQYGSDILRSCRDEPAYRVARMRAEMDAQYPEVEKFSDEQLLAFRSWVCPIRNGKGKPTASVLIQQRYDVSNSVAYLMMDSSAC